MTNLAVVIPQVFSEVTTNPLVKPSDFDKAYALLETDISAFKETIQKRRDELGLQPRGDV